MNNRGVRKATKLFGKRKLDLLTTLYALYGKGEIMEQVLTEKGFKKENSTRYVNAKAEVAVSLGASLEWFVLQ